MFRRSSSRYAVPFVVTFLCGCPGGDSSTTTAGTGGAGSAGSSSAGGAGGDAQSGGGGAPCPRVEQAVTTKATTSIATVVADDASVFWTEDYSSPVFAADRDGCGFTAPRIVATSASQFGVHFTLALSAESVLWADDAGVWASPRTGGDAVQLSAANASALVLADGRVVVATYLPYPGVGGDVRWFPLAGGDETIVWTSTVETPTALAVDGADAFVVASSALTDRRILRVPLGGGAAVPVVASAPRAGAVAVVGGDVLWTQQSSARGTDTVNPDGALLRNDTVLLGGLFGPGALALGGGFAVVAPVGPTAGLQPLVAVSLGDGARRQLAATAGGDWSTGSPGVAITSDGSVFFPRGGSDGPPTLMRTWL